MLPTTTDTLEIHRGDPYVLARWLALPGAVLDGHFELLSGLHSDRFIAFSRISRDDDALALIASWLAPSLAPHAPTAVLAPSTAGVGLGRSLASQLGVALYLSSLSDEGRPEEVIGAPNLQGHRVLLVNDIVTTGAGLKTLASLVRAAGAEPAAAAWFISRDGVDVETLVGAPEAHLADVDLPAWKVDDCNLCRAAVPPQLALDIN